MHWKPRGWKIEINNRIQCYGDYDDEKRLIRINLRKHVKDRESLHDTLIHEFLHLKFPEMSENEICNLSPVYVMPTEEWEFVARLYLKAFKKWQKTHKPFIPVRKRMKRVPLRSRDARRRYKPPLPAILCL